MKEILFKGMKKGTNEWAEGYLFEMWDRAFILWGTTVDSPTMFMVEVVPETVKQFTGQTDENGNKIFERVVSLSEATGKKELNLQSYQDKILILEQKLSQANQKVSEYEFYIQKLCKDLADFDSFARQISKTRIEKTNEEIPTCKTLMEYIESEKKKTVKKFIKEICKELWNIGRTPEGKTFNCGDITTVDLWRIAEKEFGTTEEEQ